MKQLFETYSGNEMLSELLRETTWTNNLLRPWFLVSRRTRFMPFAANAQPELQRRID